MDWWDKQRTLGSTGKSDNQIENTMAEEHLAPYMKPVSPEEYPEPCRPCRHSHMLRWLLNIPFCEHSSYTCLKRKKPCNEFERKAERQLELF